MRVMIPNEESKVLDVQYTLSYFSLQTNRSRNGMEYV
jgi:hypothetical protein